MNEQQEGFRGRRQEPPSPGAPGLGPGERLESLPRSPADEALAVDERVRLMRDGVFNNASVIVAGVIGIVLVPIMLRGLGTESYGVWIAALSVGGVVGLFDFGLGLSVTREVAASLDRETRGDAARFVKAARNAYFLVGVAGAILIAALGLPLESGLHLSPASQKIAPAVFVLAGVAFLADRLLTFTMAVLRGLRRFDTSNGLAIIWALWRAFGFIALLKLGTGLLAVMVWQVIATGAAAWVGQAVVSGLEAEFRFGWGRFDWNMVRTHLPFGIATQLTTIAEVMIWQMVPVVVGLVLGPGWIAPFYIAQKFPVSLGPIIWSTADALFPAVSQHQRDGEIARTREILEVGTRWTIVLVLPLCLVLAVIAPELLQAWVGEARAASVLVLRLMTAAVFMQGVAAPSCQVLWGRGEVRTLLMVSSSLAVTSLALSLALLPRLGMAGAAWGLLLPMLLAALTYLCIASRVCRTRVRDLLPGAAEGLLLPCLACLAATIAIQRLSRPGWVGVIATSLGSGIVYLGAFYYSGARTEELVFTRKALAAPLILGYPAYKRLRHSLARVGFLRSGYELLLAFGKALDSKFGRRLPVLLYHHVGPLRPGAPPGLTVSPQRFERQVRWLARRGYAGIRPADWAAWRRDGKPLPAKPVLFTFDDAYADLAEHALPVLRRYGFGAAVYVVTGQLGGTNAWGEARSSNTLRLMTAEQIRYWAAQGVEFGAHSRTHADLTTLAAEELAGEVVGSGNDLAELLGARVVSLAYPYGFYNQAVHNCVRGAFDLAFLAGETMEGMNYLETAPHLLRRTMVQPADSWVDVACRARWGRSPLMDLRARLLLRTRLKRAARFLLGRS